METDETKSLAAESDFEAANLSNITPLPSGALNDAYDEEEILLDNACAKASVATLAPADDPDNGY